MISGRAVRFSKNPPVKIATFALLLLIASMQVASCSSFFSPPDGSYEGSILELTIEEMLRVEEVAYTEDP